MTPVLKIYKINNAKWCKLRGRGNCIKSNRQFEKKMHFR